MGAASRRGQVAAGSQSARRPGRASLQAFHLETGPSQRRTTWPAHDLGQHLEPAEKQAREESLFASRVFMTPGIYDAGYL